MIEVKIPAAALAQIEGLGRQGQYAMVLALNRTARDVKDELRTEMKRVFDRPTNYTLNSLYTKRATRASLQAHVWVKDDRATSNAGTPATNYILPHVEGGARRIKRFEKSLQITGHMPKGWFAVPGQGARLDAHGNISTGQIIQILSQLKVTLVSGFTRNMADGAKGAAAQRKAGGRFFAMKPGGKALPGIYQREFMGNNITPVLIFVPRATYKKTFPFEAKSKQVVDDRFDRNFSAALTEALSTAFLREQTNLFP